MATAMLPPSSHHVAECFEPRLQTGDAHRRWSHVHAAARLPQIERDADHANLPPGNVGLGVERGLVRFGDVVHKFGYG